MLVFLWSSGGKCDTKRAAYMKVSLVIPTIRSLHFLNDWREHLAAIDVIVVEDHKTKQIEIPDVLCRSIIHYTHDDIENDFGKNHWIIPWKVSAVRAYGFYKAYQAGADIIVTLDDDCYPLSNDFFERHKKNLSLKTPDRWVPTYPFADHLYTRGFPYSTREKLPVKISHGIWSGMPDFDAPTHLQNQRLNVSQIPDLLSIIPRGSYYPMSTMNVAFHRDVTPLMYQFLMGEDKAGARWGYDRFDDIWSGIVVKKIVDHLGWGVVSGSPAIEHRKASDVFQNLKKESAGIEANEWFWKVIDEVRLTKSTALACYEELINKVKFPDTEYFTKLKTAMHTWVGLFEK